MAHDNVVIAGIGFLPDNIINLLLDENYSLMLCKKLQDFKLGISSLVFINDSMRFIIASSLSSNVRTGIFPYNHFQSYNKILHEKLIEIFLLIVLCFHIEIALHHNIFICDFHICSSVQCLSCIMVCLIIC